MKLIIQPDAGLVPVVQAIRLAKQTIDVAIFRLSRPEVESALAAAVQRGVKVRALVAHTNRGGEQHLRKLEQRLLAGGVAVSRTASDLIKYHGKYLIIDDALHLLGFNYTKADTIRSRSFGVQTRNRQAVQAAQRLFEADLARQPYDASQKSALIVSPETSRNALSRFISGARRHLAIYDGRVEDRAFIDLLKARVAAGVNVQIIGRARGLEVGTHVRELNDLRLHVRAIVRDGTQAFVGSQSLRRLELDRRREVGLIVNNPAVSRAILTVFAKDWESAAPRVAKPDKPKAENAQTTATGKKVTRKAGKTSTDEVPVPAPITIPASGVVDIKASAEKPAKPGKKQTPPARTSAVRSRRAS